MISHVHVMIVDDNPEMTQLLGVHLERQGYTVAMASSAEAAFDHLADNECNLIVTDVEMPGIDGLEFLKRVRQMRPAIGVVIMTAFPEAHTRNIAFKCGADGYMQKPFSLAKFSVTLERAYWNALTRADDLDVETESVQ